MYAQVRAPKGLYSETCDVDEQNADYSEEEEKNSSFRDRDTVVTTEIRDCDTKKSVLESGVPIENRTCKPRNVSQHLWEKFKTLQKRTDDATRRSTEKRIKQLQQQTLTKVQEQITDPDDLDILRDHDVRLGPPNIRQSEATAKGKKRKQTASSSEPGQSSTDSPEWKDIKGLLTVNDHLKGVDHGKYAAKTQLEKHVDAAIALGDMETAESLSDRLANREFGKRIAEAIDAKNYLHEKQKEDESVKAKKKKKLHWGFEHKQRWETKGNM